MIRSNEHEIRIWIHTLLIYVVQILRMPTVLILATTHAATNTLPNMYILT